MPIRRFKNSLFTQNKQYGILSARTGSGTSVVTSGGTQSVLGNYIYVAFTATGNSTLNISRGGSVDYLVVGGGGSGAFNGNQNGGAGGQVVTGSINIGTGSYSVTVGAGHPGWTTNGSGSSSSIFNITANGGACCANGGVGSNGPFVAAFSQFGQNGYFGGGGGRGSSGTGSLGGLGGGGQGGNCSACGGGTNGIYGLPNTGGGGGGNNGGSYATGGGGSGVVIIRYLGSLIAYD
jgi:hypothetical protein